MSPGDPAAMSIGRWVARRLRPWRPRVSSRARWEARWSDPGYDPPWGHSTFSSAVIAITREGWFRPGSRLLDIGCADGALSIALADDRFDVVGIDFAYGAIARARRQAADRRHPPRFEVCDIVQSAASGGPFDGAIDKCCFHAIPDADVEAYGRNVARSLMPDGRLLIVARLHEHEPGTRWSGLNREAALARIERGFGDAFRLVKVEDADVGASQDSKSGLIVRLERV